MRPVIIKITEATEILLMYENNTALLGRDKELNWESAWAIQTLLRAFCRLALDLYERKSD